MKRKTILVLAYSISPVRGSEYSVAWNYVKEMSENNNLIVLYGLAGDHMGDLDEIQKSEICQNMINVQFVAVQPNIVTNLFNSLNRKGILTYTFYFAYRLWHKQAYEIAQKITAERSIDLIHFLAPIGYREPGYLFKINKPYIWGPIGGIQNRPLKIILEKNITTGIKTILRNSVNLLQFKFNSRVKSALKRANLLLASTTETQKLILDTYEIQSIHLPENAITLDMLRNQKLVSFSPNECVNIIWVGSIDERKSLDILLSALSIMKTSNWHLYVVGTGHLLKKCKELSIINKINDKITWVGKVNRDVVNDYYRKSHLHAITSMGEGNPTTIWEAMSFGIPTITLDHCGMHDVVCDKCGVKVAITSLKETTNNFAIQLEHLITSPALITKLSQGVIEYSKQYDWEQRKADWEKYYDLAIKNWEEKH